MNQSKKRIISVFLSINFSLFLLFSIFQPAVAKNTTGAKVAGKIFFTDDKIKDITPEVLIKTFEKQSPKGKISRIDKGHWNTNLVAFFKKESIPGPITVWIYDKADKDSIKAKEPVQAISVDRSPSTVFVHTLDLDPDQGFAKEHTYLVIIGQIVQKKEKVYATGEMTLQK